MKILITVSQVIDALGGPFEVAQLLSTPERPVNVPAVRMWKSAGSLPSHTYVAIADALEARGMTAELSLWEKMIPPPASTATVPESAEQ